MQAGATHYSLQSLPGSEPCNHQQQILRQERLGACPHEVKPCHVYSIMRSNYTCVKSPIHTHTHTTAAGRKRKGGGGLNLTEEERDVIDLSRVEAAMQASITSLKWEYTNSLVTRLTPGLCV